MHHLLHPRGWPEHDFGRCFDPRQSRRTGEGEHRHHRGTPGSGHIEWGAVFNAIRDIGYDGWLTIESFGSNLPEIAAAAAIWRDLAAKSEDIAFDGLKFIKQAAAGK